MTLTHVSRHSGFRTKSVCQIVTQIHAFANEPPCPWIYKSHLTWIFGWCYHSASTSKLLNILAVFCVALLKWRYGNIHLTTKVLLGLPPLWEQTNSRNWTGGINQDGINQTSVNRLVSLGQVMQQWTACYFVVIRSCNWKYHVSASTIICFSLENILL